MPSATPATAAKAGEVYRSIGVRPVINARGTFTIITGSQTLPEVKRAMDEASRSYVQMDELMAGVSQKLAELTGAAWGIVTAGCCAALTHCTTASHRGRQSRAHAAPARSHRASRTKSSFRNTRAMSMITPSAWWA